MNDDLLPCPFCGSRAEFIYDDVSKPDDNFMHVECASGDCIAQRLGVFPTNRAQSIIDWNTRAPDPIRDELEAALRAGLRALKGINGDGCDDDEEGSLWWRILSRRPSRRWGNDHHRPSEPQEQVRGCEAERYLHEAL